MNGKKLVRGTILTALCMAVMLWVNGTVSEAYWVVVKSDNTRVRNTAGTDSEVMTAVNAGDKLDVVSEEQGSDGSTWYKVSINNVSGYVRSDTVEMAPEGGTDAAATTIASTEQAAATVQPVEASSSSTVEPMATQAATVKTDNVNVRANASTNGNVVAKLQSGAAVTLTGTTSDNSGKTWYQVNFINNGSNVTGFIREDFVEPGEVMEPQAPEEEASGQEDGALADIYGDMPTETDAANNDYELFYEADAEGVDCWYIHDNIAQKRYKLEQLMQADEMNTHNLEIKDKEIGRLKIVLIVLAVLLVIALAAAAFFGFKYHDLRDDDDDEDEEDEEDYRTSSSARRRGRAEAEPVSRRREPARDEERSARGTVRRTDAGAPRRSAPSGQRRPEREETGTRSVRAERVRADGEVQRRQPAGTARTRSAQPASQSRRPQASPERETVRRTGRSDVEWKSKNFLKGDEDGLDFPFINGDDEE